MEQQKQVIKTYLQRSNTANNYALLLNGKWGTGKTYYFKNTISNEIKEYSNRKVVYISLNGIKSTDEIEKQIIAEIFKHTFDFNWKTWTYFCWALFVVCVLVLALLIVFASYIFVGFLVFPLLAWFQKKQIVLYIKAIATKISISTIRMRLFIGGASGLSYIHCFDDLERCGIPIKEVLGYINTHFVEHLQEKVIIIADETEIEADVEAKNRHYPKIKEKLIGRTIDFQPNQKEIVNAILKEQEMAFLRLHRAFIDEKLDFIGDYKPWNLRTLFFAFDNLAQLKTGEYFSAEIQPDIDIQNDVPFHRWIFYTLAVSYECKHNPESEFRYLTEYQYWLNSEPADANNSDEQKIAKYKQAFYNGFPDNEGSRVHIHTFIKRGELTKMYPAS